MQDPIQLDVIKIPIPRYVLVHASRCIARAIYRYHAGTAVRDSIEFRSAMHSQVPAIEPSYEQIQSSKPDEDRIAADFRPQMHIARTTVCTTRERSPRVGWRAWGGEPWQELRERIVSRGEPVPHVQPCRERHAIVGVRLVESRPTVDLCRARLPY